MQKNVKVLQRSLIGNPVKFGDGPAAVTSPFYNEKGTSSAFVSHCTTLSLF
jgi:hypothetical protein